MAAETETGFLIDGKIYEVPSIESFTNDENEVLFNRTGYGQEDFVPEVGESTEEHEQRASKMMRHPGFWSSLMHIAYQRGNPTVKPAKVAALIGKTNRLDAVSTLGSPEEETEESPLASTSEPSESSRSGPLDNENSTPPSPESSGNGSTSTSDGLGGPPPATTALRSATSSISDHEISAA